MSDFVDVVLRRLLAWLASGSAVYAWLGWLAIHGAARSSSLLGASCWVVGTALVMHQFAALRRKNQLLSTQISLCRWVRRLDDRYFDAVQLALDSLSPEERARFDRALGDVRRGAAADSGGDGVPTPPEEGPPEHAG